ncbi:MAG: SDR family oxidoreductase [Chlamydiia bacterium]|nr:SDR family oxidoreductase [Chlamydiia bacterium]
MTAKRCLVTGGAGFIGSHLTERLLADGHHVTVLDNLETGSWANLKPVEGHTRLRLIEDSIHSSSLPNYFDGIDRVFHLAALADIVPSVEDPLRYHKANVEGTINVLEASKEAAVQRFVYAASSSCYGIPTRYPTPEGAPAQPMYPYALTKCVGEQYVMHWSQVYGLPAVSLRLFNVYGPRSRTSGSYGAVFGVFLAQKLAGKPFTIVGDGAQTRDFTYVTDVADAFARAADSALCGEIMNVGSGSTTSIQRLCELLEGPVTYIPKRPGEPNCTFADTRKIEELLGWKAQVPFAEGVRRMLEGIEGWRSAPVWEPASIAVATEKWFACLG